MSVSIHYSNITTDNNTNDLQILAVDPSITSQYAQSPVYTVDESQYHGATLAWGLPHIWFKLSDGVGGFTALAASDFATSDGTTFRLAGNATDGYTILQS
jgi:hypothetical protein